MIIKNKQDEIQDYLADASNTKGYCDAVYFPENQHEIIDLIKDANQSKTPITISGNRTGLTGAASPLGGIVIATDKLNRIIEINTGEKYVIVEPGVILSELQEEIKKHNLFYPPDPTEINCFIGGTVATNASGAKSFKYGPTRAFVTALELILPDGELLNLERGKNFAVDGNLSFKTVDDRKIEIEIPKLNMPDLKNSAGYFCKPDMDAIDLFIGSEGTLGLIKQIKLKLLNLPTKIISCVLFFKTEDSALEFIDEARSESYNTRKIQDKNSIDALGLEYFDENALQFLKEDYSNIPQNSKAAVWFEQEATERNEEELLNQWLLLFTKFGGIEEDAWYSVSEKDRMELREFRHRISAKVNEYINARNFRKLGTDVAVPDERLTGFYRAIKNIVQDAKMEYVIYGHFGNSNIHLNILPGSEEQFAGAKALYREICSLAIKTGGTFSSEHGVGKNKTEMLIEMYGNENIEMMKKIKRTLDPNTILGIGNIFNPSS